MAKPDVSVLIPTYNRAAIVRRTVELLQKNMDYGGRIRYFVGCDGTDNTPEVLKGLPDVTVFPEPTGSLGANLNRLLSATSDDYFVALDDDHWLMNMMCLCSHVHALQTDETAGWVHLLIDAVNDEHYEPYQFVGRLEGRHWRLDYRGPDQWPCSFRAHLSHRRFHEAAGLFAEGLQSGRTEMEFNQRVLRLGRDGKLPAVLVPVAAYGFDYWAHVGKSWNRQGL